MQNLMEAYLQGVIAMGTDVIGKKQAKKYLPLVATLGLFIFVSNMMEIIPGFEPPSGNINMTLTLAVIVFLYYNLHVIKSARVIHIKCHMYLL